MGVFLRELTCIHLLPNLLWIFLFLNVPNSSKTPEVFLLPDGRLEMMEELVTLDTGLKSLDSQLDLTLEVTVSAGFPPLPLPLEFCPPRPPLPPLPNTGG